MTMDTREPVQNRAIKTKEKIIRAATELFTEKTYHGVNAVEICKKANVATGSFYHYFKNKMDLFLEVLQRYVSHIISIQEEYENKINKTPLMGEAIRSFVEKVLDSHLENPGLLREMMRMTLYSDEVRILSEKVDHQNVLFFRKFLMNSIHCISEEEAVGLAWIVYYSSEGVIHQYSLEGAPMSKAQVIAQLSFIYESAIGRLIGDAQKERADER